MTIKNFIPEFWASLVLDIAQKAMVYGQPAVCNRNYEGIVAQAGDTVHITGIGDVSIVNNTDGQDLADPDEPLDAKTELKISQDKAFSFLVYDKQKKQAAGDTLNPYMRRAAYRMKDRVDQYIAGQYVDAASANCIGSTATAKVPNVTTGDAQNIFNIIQDCATKLSDADIPTEGRFMIVPPWITGLIVKDFHKEGSSAPNVSQEMQINGQVAKIAGFNILESNNVPVVADPAHSTDATKNRYKILFGTNDAITFADSINMVETLRHPKRFADVVRGRHIYGSKVGQPEYIGVLTVSQT